MCGLSRLRGVSDDIRHGLRPEVRYKNVEVNQMPTASEPWLGSYRRESCRLAMGGIKNDTHRAAIVHIRAQLTRLLAISPISQENCALFSISIKFFEPARWLLETCRGGSPFRLSRTYRLAKKFNPDCEFRKRHDGGNRHRYPLAREESCQFQRKRIRNSLGPPILTPATPRKPAQSGKIPRCRNPMDLFSSFFSPSRFS
jgi:hypothetical protein